MKRSTQTRKAARLSESLHKQLNAYALAASAAGVSLLAFATPALAKIVYTAANIPIPVNGGLVGLDVNNDGINDFELSNVYRGFTEIQTVRPARQRNRIWSMRSNQFRHCAAVVQSGSTVGPHSPFEPKNTALRMAWASNGDYGCPWYYVQGQAYLGLEFRIKGKVHFGWARVQMSGMGEKTESISGYAYETIPNKPIVAGKTKGADVFTVHPGSLGHLAQGSAGLAAWRSGK